MFSILLGIYLGVELLGRKLILFLTIWRNAGMFSKVAVPFYFPTSSVWGFWFLFVLRDTLLSVFLIIAILVGVKWRLIIVVLIRTSLIANDL